ncbi:helix-turn-helix transcriptional regulator [Clostridium sp. BJN0001]|uniref:helix-turn-helix transcriptional regulator n=1 Tax=Clostridium sp. BJN0001 TaxID=2930219 RepID=UPI001FD4E31C|nr:helix-turn-helix transcriptional regulator [Clostridium sp. BJN0001]
MVPTSIEKSIYGSLVEVEKRSENYDVYNMSKGGIVTSYHIMNGIDVIYNDMHVQSTSVDLKPPEGYFEINHCFEGKIECEFTDGECTYLSKNDLCINIKNGNCKQSYFPIGYYYGITISIEIDKAQKEINKFFNDNSIDLNKIIKKFCQKNSNEVYIMRENESIKHIFSELYSVCDKIKINYCKIKVLEILMFLSVTNQPVKEKRFYFSKSNVEKVKKIKNLITQNVEHKYTLKNLSKEYNISLTIMKICFKEMFGITIHSYIRECRIQKAASLLMKTDRNILDIANCVGYINGSKFASAFKDIIGISPKEYRKNNINI